ncbi:hypothetical protein [Staphylococcus agnetis]|uniref:hypothetical protein n=1 Tax=Staphylococcus agnetis TaxID=985762 RepID=UPI0004E2A528|nr:hypothetical protein [Staphylococcus agnetis]KFE40932.1 hypothetical protein SAGN_10288 [Staphylococcus agnetis]PTH47153.1 hypothetical protein BU587_07550 [Staphylococcus agnetis]PTH56848.1 hypothetical protein BU584_09605 [Staphylococcus agnetis]PTH72001.1 hypothetical protein BU581_10195 [Staphylococcus agnetis]PTH74329.1 hypothetical protein BU580_06185 [Staphylococcus agnetis]
MFFIILLTLILACFIVIGVYQSTHWIFNIGAAGIAVMIFFIDLWLKGWHNESFKIILICIIIIIFEFYHFQVKMRRNRQS